MVGSTVSCKMPFFLSLSTQYLPIVVSIAARFHPLLSTKWLFLRLNLPLQLIQTGIECSEHLNYRILVSFHSLHGFCVSSCTLGHACDGLVAAVSNIPMYDSIYIVQDTSSSILLGSRCHHNHPMLCTSGLSSRIKYWSIEIHSFALTSRSENALCANSLIYNYCLPALPIFCLDYIPCVKLSHIYFRPTIGFKTLQRAALAILVAELSPGIVCLTSLITLLTTITQVFIPTIYLGHAFKMIEPNIPAFH